MKTFRLMLVGGALSSGLIWLAGCGVPIVSYDEPRSNENSAARTGVEIAEAECASCHATGLSGESPHPEALEFRRFSRFYPIEHLAEALAEGIYVGHPDMPVFRFEPDEVERLIEYIETVQEPLEL